MARKNTHNRRKETKDLIDATSRLKKLESALMDPDVTHWMYSGGMKGIRERLIKIDYGVIRNVIDRVPLLNAIIKTRTNQVLSFSRFITEDQAKDGEKGWRLVCKEGEADQKEIAQLSLFLNQTGIVYSPEREDDFSDYLQLMTREICSIDQVATELQYNLAGQVAAFQILDGATIKRTSEEYPKKDVFFIQIIDDKVIEEYNHNNLIFDYKNKRADIKFRGYGYSDVEMAIDLITTLLFGYNHVRDQFVRDKIPKGFIAVMGDIDQKGISAIQQYWYSAMSGAGGQWAIPILPSGKDGVGLDFKSLSQSNKDMEYHQGMMFLSSTIAAVFNIDLAELGIKADDSSTVIGANEIGPRIQASKDRGLESLLMFIAQHINKILRKITPKYEFVFTGLEVEDQQKKATILKTRLETDLTINDILRKDGRPEIKEDYANVVLNQLAVQIYLQGKQREAQEAAQQQFGSYEDYADEGEEEMQDESTPRANNEDKEDNTEEVNKSLDIDDLGALKKIFAKASE